MRPVRIDGADPTPIGAPAGWNPDTDGDCAALFVRREKHGSMSMLRSAHEPETHEAMLLVAGAKFHLGISAVEHPVIQISVEDLPDDFSPVMVLRQGHDVAGRPQIRIDALYPKAAGRRIFACVLYGDGISVAEASRLAVDMIETKARHEGWF